MAVLAGDDQRSGALAQDCVTVETTLNAFLDRKAAELDQLGVPMFVGMLRKLLAGGKRLRPLFCSCGWRVTGGTGPLPPRVAQVAASLELFHTFCLIHDDVMDSSDLRHGLPTTHRAIAALHADHPDADQLGINGAILLGDVTLSWSYELLHAAAAPESVWQLVAAMHVETLAGQSLDLTGTEGGVEEALRVYRYKTAAYTTQRPLQIGALLGDAVPGTVEMLGRIGVLAGEAFQLRDDLLGVYGVPNRTGKSVLDDLRMGKSTVLLALARQRADPKHARLLTELVGDRGLTEAGVESIREILVVTGARHTVEQMIIDRHERALTELADAGLHADGADALRDLLGSIACRQQ